ncbi:unnamed protein product [Rhizoctonia solani]|uniref:Conserved oligomeric Golgi complex subunit 2 n=1 Tax=Rhizoctonia solani TaxID=456999 RepID=A0A8H3DSN8_9AGAM|nr:unnamed protein product [Rhizoctonia solani]
MEDEDGLPYIAPLDASHPLLSALGEAFDVDEFLLSRSHTSLPDLRTELNNYLNKLRTELVHLINENYADFISLSTDLRGEGETIELMRAPLSVIITEIETSRTELRDIQDAVQTKLDSRTALREEQGVLRLLLKLADSVSRVEVLLAISPSSDETSAAGNTSPQTTTMPSPDGLGLRGMDGLRLHVTEDDNDPKHRAGYAKHLSRAAGELSQVLYLADKARENSCALVDTLQFRIDRIVSTLSRDLDHHLSSTLRALTDSSTMPSTASAERARLTSELVECFKIYDALKMWREAEDVVRRELVRPFMKKTIHPASLTAPQSPILPRTPFAHPPATSLLPHTPFTPFAPLATAAASSFSPNIHPEILIPEPDMGDTNTSSNDKTAAIDEAGGADALVGLYNKILRFVQRDVMGVVRVAESVSAKSRRGTSHIFGGMSPGGLGISPGGLPPSSSIGASPIGPGVVGVDLGATENPERIEIVANVVWAELARALMDELGSTVFAVGRPDEFRQNYTTTQHLISALEALAPRASIPALRAHPLTSTFSRRWQLPVYFQLRWKDIVGKCEGVLGSGAGDKQEFTTPQANAIYAGIKTCWSTQVYIPELGHRFWRLTLQASTLVTWMDASLPLKDASAVQPDRVTTLAAPGARPATPDPLERNNADDASLSTLGCTLSDLRLLQQKVQALWIDVIQVLLPDGIDAGEEEEKAEDTLIRSLASIGSYEKTISARAITILTKRCAEPLANAKSIPVQYRGARRSVTEPSPFVAAVWRPLATFFGNNGPGERLKGDLGREWCSSIFEEVVARYIALLIKIKQTEQSIRRVNRMPTFSLFGARNAGGEERDDERIRAQMMLDVDSLGNEARALGFGMAEVVDNSEGYKELKRVASQGEAEPTTPA